MYIRRIKKTDLADDFRTAIRLAIFRNGYGAFLHGKRNCGVVVVGATKKRVKEQFFSPKWEQAKYMFADSRRKILNKKSNNLQLPHVAMLKP